jgi:hypothetical protein
MSLVQLELPIPSILIDMVPRSDLIVLNFLDSEKFSRLRNQRIGVNIRRSLLGTNNFG